MKQPAVFIDRDGTLIEEVNFLSRVEDLRLFEFSASAVRSLKEAGYLVIVVTNQSGIGRGIYTESAMHEIHKEIQNRLGGAIDAFYFCPHLPLDGCECRKPNLGMLESACVDFQVDMENSWMVGDKKIDVETGQKARVQTALVLTGYGDKHRDLLEVLPTIISNNFAETVTEILRAP